MKKFTAIFLIIAISVAVGFGAQKLEDHTTKVKHPLKYSEFVEKYAAEYEIPETLLYAMIKCESSFDPKAKSSAGAVGLMQLMPRTFEDMARRQGEEFDKNMMSDAETNIRYGAYYLHYLYNIFRDWNLVLAAYNGGMGNVKKWMQSSEFYDGTKLIKYPKGYSETENYVKKVNETKKLYEKLYFTEKI